MYTVRDWFYATTCVCTYSMSLWLHVKLAIEVMMLSHVNLCGSAVATYGVPYRSAGKRTHSQIACECYVRTILVIQVSTLVTRARDPARLPARRFAVVNGKL